MNTFLPRMKHNFEIAIVWSSFPMPAPDRRVVLAVVLSAVGHAVQVVPTNSPQKHIDQSARLLKKVIGLIQNGVFRELDRANESEDATDESAS